MKEAVGSLLWLSTMTQPDIMNSVQAVACYAHVPIERLWQAVMKTLSCLNGTKSFGITYVRGSGLGLEILRRPTTPTRLMIGVRCLG